jgi:hypothetical protein
MSKYYDSLENADQSADEIQQRLDKKLQNNFDIWSGTLELDIQINERDLELLEYFLSKLEDNVYSMAEAAALMVGNLKLDGSNEGQLGEYLNNLSIYKQSIDDLNQKFADGEISEAGYEEGL